MKMETNKAEFAGMAWETLAEGAKQKELRTETKRVRLVRFEDTFVEADWCMRGHAGYVLAGAMTIDFDGNHVQYHSGDAFIIEAGAEHKHKAIIEQGGFVELLLVEAIES